MAETIRAMHEQRCGCDLTKRIVRPDGEVRYVRCVGVPVVEDGIFTGFNGTKMDVTEHELLTQELRRQQAYLNEAQSLTKGKLGVQSGHATNIPLIGRKCSPVWFRSQPRPDCI
jgi:hypothetical protein